MRSFLSLAVCYLCIISIGYAQNTSTINTKNIEIVRDSFGVPHIFGKTDAEAAFGLAWATAEDDTSNSQYLLSAIKGLLGKRLGMEGAKIDFAIQFLGTMDYVEANYEKEIPDDFWILFAI